MNRLSIHESVTVSGELQGGVLVAPRGQVRDERSRGEYQRTLIELLSELAAHDDEVTARRAAEVLASALHPHIDDPQVGRR